MIISLGEAADMSFRAALSVAITIGGMMAATALVKSESADSNELDLSRPVLWTVEPVRIANGKSGASGVGPEQLSLETGNSVCANDIGLRIACDLIRSAAL